MSKFENVLKAVKIGSGVAKVFVPGAAGSVLDAVNKGLEKADDPATAELLKTIAKDNDEQTQAILALHERVKKLESK